MIRIARSLLTGFFALAMSLSTLHAVDYELIGNSWSEDPEKLFKVDFASGALTPFATMSTKNIMGIAYSEPGDFIYATTIHLSTPPKSLLKINRFTGATISQHSAGFEDFSNVSEGDVAVQKSTGHVFSVRSGGTIAVWDPVTQTTLRTFVIPTLEFEDTSTLAFNAAGELFTIDPNSRSVAQPMLYNINPTTGAIISSVPLSVKIGVVGGMAFHPVTGQAFVTDFCIGDVDGSDLCTGSHLYLLNSSTGQLDLIGPTSIGLSGLTFVPTFTASPAPDIAVSTAAGAITDGQTTPVAFEQNTFGGGTSTSFSVRNNSVTDSLVISNITVPAGFSRSSAVFPLSILPGRTYSFSISNIGPLQQVYSGIVHISSSDTDEADFDFPITAPYNTPDIELNSFFGEITDGEAYPARTTTWGTPVGMFLTVINRNPGPLIVTGVNLPAGFGYSGTPPTFPFTVNKNGQSGEIRLTLTGENPGTYSGTVTILTNDFDESSFEIPVSGTVTANSITFLNISDSMIEGGSINASAIGADFTQPTYQWDLDADGQFDDATRATIQLPNTDGPGSINVAVKITDSLSSIVRAATVAIENRNPFPSVTAQPNSIPANTLFQLNLAATDAALDLAAGFSWTVDWGDGSTTTAPAGSPAVFSPAHSYTQTGGFREITLTVVDQNGGIGISTTGLWVSGEFITVFDGPSLDDPQLFDESSQITFDANGLGVPVIREFTILNRSTDVRTFGSITLPPGFSLVNPATFPLILSPGAAQTIAIRFDALAFGTIEGTMSIATPDPAMPTFDLAFTGNVQAPDIGVRSSNLEKTFEDGTGVWSNTVSVGSSFADRTFTLSNDNGSVPLTVTALNLPAGYSLVDPPTFPLILGGDFDSSIDLTLRVNTAVPGVIEGRVEIISNDPDENPFDFIVVTRVGNASDLIVLREEQAGNFINSYMEGGEAVILNNQTAPLTFSGPSASLRLYNQGNQPLTISALTLPAGFTFATAPILPAVLNASQSLNLTINVSGSHSGNLVITSTDPNENPYNVPLSAISAITPTAPLIAGLTLVHPIGGNPAKFSATISGTPLATIILEASTDLGAADPWANLSQITLDAAGHGQFVNVPDPATATPPAPRNFYRLRSN